MSAEGIFHNAHEVYARPDSNHIWVWFATFALKTFADDWVEHALTIDPSYEYEVRPV